jgi:hypothetical protein
MLLPGKANENRNHPGSGLLSQDQKCENPEGDPPNDSIE